MKYRYRIDIVSNSKNQYRCITSVRCGIEARRRLNLRWDDKSMGIVKCSP